MKKVRHYKTLRNALTRLYYQSIYIPDVRDTTKGHIWLYGWGEGYIRHKLDKPCTAEYDQFRDLWTIRIGR